MDQREWRQICKVDRCLLDWKYYNKTRKLQRSLQCNSDPNAKIIHHLRDTEEQRKYNDEHYELWGHNLDGTFEYGKYVIFVTKEEHNHYHKDSDETKEKKRFAQIKRYESFEERRKVSERFKGKTLSDERKEKLRQCNLGRHHSEESKENLRKKCSGWHHTDEARQKISDAGKGREFSEESRNKISKALKEKYASGWISPITGRAVSEETRKKIGDANRGENNGMYGKHLSEDHKRKISESGKSAWTDERRIQQSIRMRNTTLSDEAKASISKTKQLKVSLYNRYKLQGGLLKWNAFNKYFKEIYNDSADTFNIGFTV